MKDKKMFIIVITIMLLTLALSAYMIYKQFANKEEEPEEIIEEVGMPLAEIADQINGYWQEEDSQFNLTGFNSGELTYSNFVFASEGGVGGSIQSYEYVDTDKYNLKIMLNPHLMCTEEYCEEGATIGQMSEPEEITLTIDLSEINQHKITINDKKMRYLCATFDEIEKIIYN